jgi:rubrerythrin
VKLYQQIKDIISLAADFHGRVGKFYEGLYDDAEKEKVAMLLRYLSRHEKRLQKGLKQYSMEEQKNRGDTWLQYVPEDEKLSLKDLAPPSDLSVDDLIGVIQEMANRLLGFYQEMAHSGAIPVEVRDIFRQLAEQEKQEKAKLVLVAEQSKKT